MLCLRSMDFWVLSTFLVWGLLDPLLHLLPPLLPPGPILPPLPPSNPLPRNDGVLAGIIDSKRDLDGRRVGELRLSCQY